MDDLDDAMELGMEGFDKLVDKGIPYLPDSAMHMHTYHPRNIKKLGSIGRGPQKQQSEGTPSTSQSTRGRRGPPDQDGDMYTSASSRGAPQGADTLRSVSSRGDIQSRERYRPGSSRADPISRDISRDRADAYGVELYQNPGYGEMPAPYYGAVTSYYPPAQDPERCHPPAMESSPERKRRRKHRHKRHHRHHSPPPDLDYRSDSLDRSVVSRPRSPGRPGLVRRSSSMGDLALDPPRRRHRHRKHRDESKEAQIQFFSQTSKGLGAGAFGAIAGGWAAKEAQERRNRKGSETKGKGAKDHQWILTLLGAAAGGLGANALVEKAEERIDRK